MTGRLLLITTSLSVCVSSLSIILNVLSPTNSNSLMLYVLKPNIETSIVYFPLKMFSIVNIPLSSDIVPFGFSELDTWCKIMFA